MLTSAIRKRPLPVVIYVRPKGESNPTRKEAMPYETIAETTPSKKRHRSNPPLLGYVFAVQREVWCHGCVGVQIP